MNSSHEHRAESSFFRLPKEIRLNIYERTLSLYKQVKVGSRDFNDQRLTPWPTQPGICRTCRLTRSETLAMYYSNIVLVLNIQRPSGEDMVIQWLDRLFNSWALNNIKHVSIITGYGYTEPPKEYMLDMQRNLLVLATRPCAAAYMYKLRSNMRRWTKLASGSLKKRLAELPKKGELEFSVSKNLREVIAAVGEPSGFGLYDDFRCIEESSTLTAKSTGKASLSASPPLLNLPKELRLAIYEHALLSTTPVTIGQRALSKQDLTDQPTLPPLILTSSLIRQESLPIYFATTHFILNIQRTQCHDIVIDWIHRNSCAYPVAFQRIQHVSVVAGSGIRQPPRQYEFYMQQTRLLSTIDRPILQPYTLPANRWSPPPWEELRDVLKGMKRKGDVGFDAGVNLREIVEVLARCSD